MKHEIHYARTEAGIQITMTYPSSVSRYAPASMVCGLRQPGEKRSPAMDRTGRVTSPEGADGLQRAVLAAQAELRRQKDESALWWSGLGARLADRTAALRGGA